MYLHKHGQSGGLSGPEQMESKPYAPRQLCETGKEFWREYVQVLHDAGMLFETDLNTLKDLCRWESLKDRIFNELPSVEKKMYLEYYSKDGRLTHVQPHAGFVNLRSAQVMINKLREQLGLTMKARSGLSLPKRSTTQGITHGTPHRKKVTGYKGKDF